MVEKNGKKYLIQQYFIPKDKLDEKNKDDKVPYDLWAERGFLTLCEGARVNPSDVTRWFLKMHYDYDISAYWVGYDRYEAKYWVSEMENERIPNGRSHSGSNNIFKSNETIRSRFKREKIKLQ